MPHNLPPADELSSLHARTSGLLLSPETVGTAIGLVTSVAAETVPGCAGAGLTLVDEGGAPSSSGASDEVVLRADDLQYSLGEGPCLTACADRLLVRVDDLGAEHRWPRWARDAAALGLRSAMSAPLVAGDRALGALKVYSAVRGAFQERSARVLALLGAQAAIVLAHAGSAQAAGRLSEGLRSALRSRDVINTARGVVMERRDVDGDRALAVLIAAGRHEGRTLHDVAVDLVRPGSRGRRPPDPS
ncbi:GAF and ANTAR domain-containing protein [Pseudonocardia sp. KRD-182]|uniref:GAF and ANTAR domain-containing protein n=1 Tax=Pseudonocardia oceani TaxID=2792013 RepID=UPI001C49DBB4|nr:GAF and ANTAR domain-containing protein [Pseudonocardia oceani]MBW0108417.1 GAF and ANTAR domain-containing protein [Pseudonocardia oceani]